MSKISPQQQKIVDELKDNELTAWILNNGKVDHVTFKRLAGFQPHLSSFKALAKNGAIECYNFCHRPGYKYSWEFYRLAK